MPYLRTRRACVAALIAGVLALALLPAAPVTVAPATVLPVPANTDLVLVSPAQGIDAAALRNGLRALGYSALDGAADDLAVRVRVPAGADPAAVAAALADSGLARGVEPDAIIHAEREPNDPLYAARQASYLDVIHAPQAWDRATGSAGVLIAVIDSGVSYSHPDLRDRLFYNTKETALSRVDADGNGCPGDIVGCNFVSLATADPSCGYTQAPPNWRAWDDEGHGTFVAGLAAAAGDNGVGITGIAWQARILPVKVLDCTATGRIADAAAGIRYAARMGADVINISFGATNDSLVLREAIQEAQRLGSLIVASAGNDSRRGTTYPAAYPGVIAVAASGLATAGGIDYRTLASFTNFGPVDVMAPGAGLLSTVPPELCGRHNWVCSGGPYAVASGSSFATPIVAGAAALLRARYPDVSPLFLRGLLLSSRQAGETPRDPGLLDLGAALNQPLFRLAAPGTSRTGGGDAPSGPADPS